MTRYLMSVRVDRSAPDAFAYMADLRNFAEWDPGTKESTQVGGSGPALGATYDLKTGGAELRYEITRFDPPREVQARARNRFVTSVDTISVAPDGDGSVITYDATLTLNGPLRIADRLLKPVFDRLGDKAADGLAEQLGGTRLT